MRIFGLFIAMTAVTLASCKPMAGSDIKSYDALVNQQRTSQVCGMSDVELNALAQTNPALHKIASSQWDQSLSEITGRLTADSVAPADSVMALRRVWLATPPAIRALFTGPESNARIRLADRASFSSLCAPPNRGTASGEAVDLQACWKVEPLAGQSQSAPSIVMTVLNEPDVIHRAFIPVIVATTMETRLQANGAGFAAMQASLRGSLLAIGQATVSDFEASDRGRKLVQDFQKGFGVASSQELSMSIPFQILALSELLDAAYCSRDTYQRFVTAAELPMPKSVAAIAQWAAADSAQEPWFFRLADASR